jgi:hypothetical protein
MMLMSHCSSIALAGCLLFVLCWLVVADCWLVVADFWQHCSAAAADGMRSTAL